ncbi:WD40 repeat domain-containing protein, partial [Singulisphaera rosea]
RGHREILLIKPMIASAIGFSQRGDLLRICGRDGVVSTFKVADGSQVHAEKIAGIARAPFAEFASDGKTLATLDMQGTITVCTIDDENHLKVMSQGSSGTKPDVGRTGGMIAAGGRITLLPGGRSVAIVEDNKDILLVDPGGGNRRRSAPIKAYIATFSSSGDVIASTDFDCPILWEPGTGKIRKPNEPGHRGGLHALAVALSPDGKSLASSGDDGSVKLWDTETMKCQADLLDHSGFVDALAFSPDGKILASGGVDKTVRLWNVATGHHLLTLEGHTAMVRQIRFSPDGSTLMTYAESPGRPPEVYLWPAPIEQPEGPYPAGSPIDNRMTISHPSY